MDEHEIEASNEFASGLIAIAVCMVVVSILRAFGLI
jgi:hypothetical protein